MSATTVPIVILGGCDSEPAALPERGRDKHALRGFKGVDIRIDGRPMIQVVIERLEASGAFGPVFIAGPESVYGPHGLTAEVIDTDGSFGENIRAAVQAVGARCPGRPLGFTTCDILPEVDTLKALMRDFAGAWPCDIWCPMIRAPENPERLGSSAWKPKYRIVPGPGAPAVPVLPGHLTIADTSAVRLDFIYRLFQIGYSTRNRSIRYRSAVMVRSLLAELLYQDLRHILGLRWPPLTWSALAWGLPAGHKLRRGIVTRTELEDALRRMFVTTAHRKRYPERRVLVPIVEGLSMAIDLDTEEEARERGGVLVKGPDLADDAKAPRPA